MQGKICQTVLNNIINVLSLAQSENTCKTSKSSCL